MICLQINLIGMDTSNIQIFKIDRINQKCYKSELQDFQDIEIMRGKNKTYYVTSNFSIRDKKGGQLPQS